MREIIQGYTVHACAVREIVKSEFRRHVGEGVCIWILIPEIDVIHSCLGLIYRHVYLQLLLVNKTLYTVRIW